MAPNVFFRTNTKYSQVLFPIREDKSERDVKNKTGVFFWINYSISGQCFHFIPPENKRKPFEDFFVITEKGHERRSFCKANFTNAPTKHFYLYIFGFDNVRISKTRKAAELTTTSGISS